MEQLSEQTFNCSYAAGENIIPNFHHMNDCPYIISEYSVPCLLPLDGGDTITCALASRQAIKGRLCHFYVIYLERRHLF